MAEDEAKPLDVMLSDVLEVAKPAFYTLLTSGIPRIRRINYRAIKIAMIAAMEYHSDEQEGSEEGEGGDDDED